MTTAATRPATTDDLPLVQQTLYLALAWDPNDPIPPLEVIIEHPEVTRYHIGWLRPGDTGIVAEVDGEFAGMAYYRLFTDEDHGDGYIDPATPELAIAIVPGHRGKGLGTRLMEELAETARTNGIARISLSVSKANPARRLYERVGYESASADDEELMVLDLD